MSLLQVAAAQIGKSATAANNFVLRTLIDGAFRLSRGNADAPGADLIKIDAANDVTLAGNLLTGAFGLGQTYADYVSTRVYETVYTNNTGKPIFVLLFGVSTVNMGFTFYINGYGMSGPTQPAGMAMSVAFIVPPGATYRVALPGGTITNPHWWEMR